jgi:hypothetical protein
MLLLGRSQCADHDVIPVRIPERELSGSSVGIHLRLLFESGDERAGPRQRIVEVINTEEQE